VAVLPAEPAQVLGYYSISPGSIEFARVPSGLTRKLGRYEVPVFRLARLAVSHSLQGRGLGGELLLAAGARGFAVAAEIGGVALAIDANDARAARWYERFSAIRLLDDPLKLILPLTVIAEAITAAQKKIRCISSPFSRTVDLNTIEILFSQRLLALQHEAVQCPIARYKGTLATMRGDAISFNQKIGNAIVTLNWEPYAQSEDEDPIDATIYTGQSEMSQDHPTAWQYCIAPSYAENKVYVSAPFLKSESLYATETAFAKALHESELPHDVIQCPNGTDEPKILSMRQHAISFNQDRGNTIVTLDWTLQNRSGG
jgi:hypothetical protein